MTVASKARIAGTVNYNVTCEACGHHFVQVGRPYNFWRYSKQHYGIDPGTKRALQREIVQEAVTKGTLSFREDARTVRAGKIVAVKSRKKRPRR